MRYGYLSTYIEGVAIKRLRKVEVNPQKSNQHELNGSEPLKQLLGLESFYDRPAKFIWLGGENEGITETARVTWYDSRIKQPGRGAEWRLYYQTNPVMELALEGNLLVVARMPRNQLTLIIAPDGTTANQLAWLFGIRDELEEIGEEFRLKKIGDDREIDFVTRYILDDLDIEFKEPEMVRLYELLLEQFRNQSPSPQELSKFVRDRVTTNVSVNDDPDSTLLIWMNAAKALFQNIERRELMIRLNRGFVGRKMPSGKTDSDVEGFLQYSRLIRSRRRIQITQVLDYFLSTIFDARKLRYTRNFQIKKRTRLNFLFPGQDEYLDPSFPVERLTMLSAETSSKVNWLKVLSEAKRIPDKHLISLEPSISENVTNQMQTSRLQLVVPRAIQETFGAEQRNWLISLSDFIKLVARRQLY